MDEKYTPTTEEVREAYQLTGDGLDFKRAALRRGQEFDRWLDEHERKLVEDVQSEWEAYELD